MRTPNGTMVIPNNTQAAPPAAAVAGGQALDLTQAEDRAFLTWTIADRARACEPVRPSYEPC